MAVWQVDFSVVPRRSLAAALVQPREAMDGDWWTSAPLPADLKGTLAVVAPPASSWDADLQRWGKEDGNCVDVWSVRGRVARISARVDVRRLDAKFGAMLLHFVRIADAVLVRRDGLVVAPDVGAFAAGLRSSDAWRFANDPAEFLASQEDAELHEE